MKILEGKRNLKESNMMESTKRKLRAAINKKFNANRFARTTLS